MKNILITCFALGLCTVTKAQITTMDTSSFAKNQLFVKDKVSLGVQAGLNYSSLYGKEIDYIFANKQTEFATGFHFGLVVDNQVGERWMLRHALIFNHKAAGVQLSDSIQGPYRTKLKMSYLEFQPANVVFQLKNFQLYAGPYISALLNAHVQRKDEDGRFFKDTDIYGSPGNDESESRYLQKYDFGFNAGLEYQLRSGFTIGARYAHGLTDLFQYANSYSLEDSKNDKIKIYNKSLGLYVFFSVSNISYRYHLNWINKNY